MFYNLENDFNSNNGCDTCETVPMQQSPMMQQPTNPYVVNNGNMMQPPQTPTVPVVQLPPTTTQQMPATPEVSLDAAAQENAIQYTNEPVMTAPDFTNIVEGFGGGPYTVQQMQRKLLLAVLVIVSALAINECLKFYLNRGVQTCEGTSYHYLTYAVIALCVLVIANRMTRHMM